MYPILSSNTLPSTVLDTISSLFTLTSSICSLLFIVNSTSVPFLPLIMVIASSEFWADTTLPSTFNILSPAFIPLFSAGEPSIGAIIVIWSSSDVGLMYTPIPTNEPLVCSFNFSNSALV